MFVEIDGADERLLYRDIYRPNGEFSTGWTTIEIDGAVVWSMSYHGWCKGDDPEVLRFLKSCLSAAYRSSEFHGGRGLPHVTDEARGLAYRNRPLQRGFETFSGREAIYRPDSPHPGEPVFWHDYQGLLMLPGNESAWI